MKDQTTRGAGGFTRRARKRLGDDRGIALITVTLVGVAVAGLLAVLLVNTARNYRESREERQIGQVLVLAESGLGEAVFELNHDNAFTTVGVMSDGLDDAAEKAWVVDQAASLPTIQGENGEYVIVKPAGTDAVYSVAYTPARDVPHAQVRLIKADLFVSPPVPGSPLLPDVGFSSAGNLTVGDSSSAGIFGTVGGAHANENLLGSGGATVAGCTSAYLVNDFAATNPPGCGDATGVFDPVPEVEPLFFHSLAMFDLCVEGGIGVVRAGPAYSGPGTPAVDGKPCTGDNLGVPTSFGWQFELGVWDYQSGAGVFYVAGGDIDVIAQDSGTGSNGATIIAAADNERSLTCDEATGIGTVAGGDIKIAGGTTFSPHSSAGDLAMVAGRDISVQGNANIWGALLAREQVGLAGTPGANNVIVGSSRCDTPGSPEGENELSGAATVTYNGGLSIPNYGSVSPIWNVSIDRWSEL